MILRKKTQKKAVQLRNEFIPEVNKLIPEDDHHTIR